MDLELPLRIPSLLCGTHKCFQCSIILIPINMTWMVRMMMRMRMRRFILTELVCWQQRLLLALNISRDLQARVRTPCPTHKYTNRETQIRTYKYTNTSNTRRDLQACVLHVRTTNANTKGRKLGDGGCKHTQTRQYKYV